jgi:hypothetical protein
MGSGAFAHTPFGKQLQREQQEQQREQEERQRRAWISQGLCQSCSGKLSAFGKKCKTCGKAN